MVEPVKSYRQQQREHQELKRLIAESIKEYASTRTVDRIRHYIAKSPKVVEPKLSEDERRRRDLTGIVFIMKMGGLTEERIAKDLSISVQSVRRYYSRGYKKIDYREV